MGDGGAIQCVELVAGGQVAAGRAGDRVGHAGAVTRITSSI